MVRKKKFFFSLLLAVTVRVSAVHGCSGELGKAAVPSLASLFAASYAAQPPRQRIHPSVVRDIWTLRPGQEVYVPTRVLRDIFPSLTLPKGRLEQAVAKAEVIKVDSRQTWKNQPCIHLKVNELGPFAVPVDKISGQLYFHALFFHEAPFSSLEWVVVDSHLMRFIRMRPDGRYLVRREHARSGATEAPEVEIAVEPSRVRGLMTGSLPAFEKALAPFLGISLRFSRGEMVRAKQKDGRLTLATVIDPGFEYSEILLHGKTYPTSNRNLFKYSGYQEPQLVLKRSRWEPQQLEGAFELFLTGARLLTSHPEFLAMNSHDQRRTIARYIIRFTGIHVNSDELRSQKITQIHQVLEIGAGGCQQKSFLFFGILKEMGLEAQLLSNGLHAYAAEYLEAGTPAVPHVLEVSFHLDEIVPEEINVLVSGSVRPVWNISQSILSDPFGEDAHSYGNVGQLLTGTANLPLPRKRAAP